MPSLTHATQAACLVLLGLSVTAAGARQSSKSEIGIQALFSLRVGVYPLALSPDGTCIAFSAMSTDGKSRQEVWLLKVDNDTAPVLIGAGILPQWSPDGSKLAFYSDRSGNFQLWTIDATDLHAEQVTAVPGGINPDSRAIAGGYVWSPLRYGWSLDSKSIVFSSRAPVGQVATPSTNTDNSKQTEALASVFDSGDSTETYYQSLFAAAFPKYRDWVFWETDSAVQPLPTASNHLFIVDVITGNSRQLTHGPDSFFSPAWASDGQAIFASRVPAEVVNRATFAGIAYSASSVVSVSVPNGASRELVAASQTIKWDAVQSHNSASILFLEKKPNGFNDALVLSLTSRQVTRLGNLVNNRSISKAWWLGRTNEVALQLDDGVNDSIRIVNIETMNVRSVSAHNAAARSSLSAATTPQLAWLQNDARDPLQIRIYDDRVQQETFAFRFNPQTDDWNLGPQTVVRWINKRGDKLEGVLILPAKRSTQERVPVIIDLYPDSKNSFKGWPMSGNRHWSSRGYAVFFLTSRAPHVWLNPGRDESYPAAGKGSDGWRINEDDIATGIEKLLELKDIDPHRMCVYGFSNGGAVAAELIARDHRFKCAVIVAPALTNWIRPAITGESNVMQQFAGGVSVWSDFQDYVALSPIARAGRIKTPTLVVAGENDGNFLLNGIELFNGIQASGTHTQLVVYRNQGHVLTGSALNDFVERLDVFFDSYLQDERSELRTTINGESSTH